jgi:putative PIN family toxin of toxin-antitoxin system
VRLVLDTSVIVSAFRSTTGASRLLLDHVMCGNIRLVASASLFFEYEDVLTRPDQIAAHGISPQRIEQFLIALAGFTDRTRIHFHLRPQLRDPGDELVLATAVNGHADALVTHNIRHFLPEASRLGVKVLTPGRIIEIRGNR